MSVRCFSTCVQPLSKKHLLISDPCPNNLNGFVRNGRQPFYAIESQAGLHWIGHQGSSTPTSLPWAGMPKMRGIVKYLPSISTSVNRVPCQSSLYPGQDQPVLTFSCWSTEHSKRQWSDQVPVFVVMYQTSLWIAALLQSSRRADAVSLCD